MGPLLGPAQPQGSGIGRRYLLIPGKLGSPWAGIFHLCLSERGSMTLGVLVMWFLRPHLPRDMNSLSYPLFCLDFSIVEGDGIRALGQHRLLQLSELVLVIFSLEEAQLSTVPSAWHPQDPPPIREAPHWVCKPPPG